MNYNLAGPLLEFSFKDLWAPITLLGSILAAALTLGGSLRQIRQNKEDIEHIKQNYVTKADIHNKLKLLDHKLTASNRMTAMQIRMQQNSQKQLVAEIKALKKHPSD